MSNLWQSVFNMENGWTHTPTEVLSFPHLHLKCEWFLNTWLCLHTWTAIRRRARSWRTEPCVSQQRRDNRLSARGRYKLDVVAERLKIERWSDNGLKFMIINTQRSGHTCQSVQRDGWYQSPTYTHTHTHNFTLNAFSDEESPDSWQVFYLLHVWRGKSDFSPLLLLNVLLSVCLCVCVRAWVSVWAGFVTWL